MCGSDEICCVMWLVCGIWFGNVEFWVYVGRKLVGGDWILFVGCYFGDNVVEFFFMVGVMWGSVDIVGGE